MRRISAKENCFHPNNRAGFRATERIRVGNISFRRGVLLALCRICSYLPFRCLHSFCRRFPIALNSFVTYRSTTHLRTFVIKVWLESLLLKYFGLSPTPPILCIQKCKLLGIAVAITLESFACHRIIKLQLFTWDRIILIWFSKRL